MTDPARIAQALATAHRERRAIAPFTDEHPELDEATAYDAQWAGVTARLEGMMPTVETVAGNYSNVVGLPVPRVYWLFAELGYDLKALREP